MPAFRDALSQGQIGMVIDYLRGLCTEKTWPRGNFNLPRPLITEKAFPEDEVVLTGVTNLHGAPGGNATVIYEKRIGPSGMIEAAVPYKIAHDSGVTRSGFGDIALGYKRKLFDSLKEGFHLQRGRRGDCPDRKSAHWATGPGLPFLKPSRPTGRFFLRAVLSSSIRGSNFSTQPDKLPRAYYLHTAIGKTFITGKGFGRWWTPMTEFIADRDLESGAVTNWDVVPQIQIPISKRMHILANVGFRIPVNNTAGPAQTIPDLFPVGLRGWQLEAGLEMRIGGRTIRASIILLAFTGSGVGIARAQDGKGAQAAARRGTQRSYPKTFGTHFETSDRCVACHNGISTPTGEDISIGVAWRTSMMANSGRDPYWISGVRRETIDHPSCSRGHSGRMHHLPHADDALRIQTDRPGG